MYAFRYFSPQNLKLEPTLTYAFFFLKKKRWIFILCVCIRCVHVDPCTPEEIIIYSGSEITEMVPQT